MFPTSIHVGPQSVAHPPCLRSQPSLRRGETSTSGRSLPLHALTKHDSGCVRRWRVKSSKPYAQEAYLSSGTDILQPETTENSETPENCIVLDGELVEVPERYKGLPENELCRRLRISRRNKGNRPWNKGRKHSEATKELIREKTRKAMQRDSVLQKCRIHYNSRQKLSEERKAQISASMKAAIRAKKVKEKVDNFLTPKGLDEDKKKKAEIVAAKVEKVKKVKPAKPSKPAKSPHDPKSDEHRAKIAEAIRRKWRDPEYQMKQRIGCKNARERTEGMPRRPRSGSGHNKEQEKKYLEVVKHIKQLQTGIRDLENQRDLLSNDGESVEEIHDLLEETTSILSNVLEQVKPIHEKLGPKLGVEISFNVKKVQRPVASQEN
ncbi:hypothetical protein BSKO_08012 [Bryopsis sp. KO-2023]|nr:hypothetical protein BSKO_08012 [Bryopsis sp. KO-2023]